ncbi:ATP-dependent zinc protease [Shivajiella indica]|uniref:ATP-dependent zinc protease n=1 Tax=Shivajiella indica TaxID=872115 RepID=A0ABW5B4N2_9BACT
MKKIIGRREKISLPEWGLKDISGKIDTGAYTSSIHCEYWEEKQEGGEKVLYYIVLPKNHPKYNGKIIRTQNYSQKKVKNSFGQEEVRYKVNTKVIMFGEEFEMEFTLSDRSKMKNPILLGRKVLGGKFLVDVQEVNLSKKSRK